MSRIVLVTFGSLGDLHPYLALGTELRARGHAVVLATHGVYRDVVRGAGLEFALTRPDPASGPGAEAAMRRAMDLRRGSTVVLREFVLPSVRETTTDLLAATAGADLIVDHVLGLGAVLAAELRGIPRVHAVLQPMAMWSLYDPPRLPMFPGSAAFRALPVPARRALWRAGLAATNHWFAPVRALRRELGLPATRRHPVFEMGSEHLNLALFSPLFGAPQPDWPPHTLATGFLAWDSDAGWTPELAAFLDNGEPPLVFTLGSSAVHAAHDFYAEAVVATRALGMRAVFLTGLDGRNPLPEAADDPRLLATGYAPHARLFPHAAAIVHQGGIGTTARALAAGRPMLVVPWSHDQPDNAARCAQLGVARVLPRRRWRAASAAAELRALLADTALRERAAAVGARIAAERGTACAAAALEALLARLEAHA